MVVDGAGNLYGNASEGGASDLGTVFKVDPTGTETVLYTFVGGPTGGFPEQPSLIMDTAGNLYGTTFGGGPGGGGTVYKLNATTGAETVLYGFTAADGKGPEAGLLRDAAGNLYGTTTFGGASSACGASGGCGVAFKLDPAGTETVLYIFSGGADGAIPESDLIQDAAGNLYGTASEAGFTGGACGASGCGVVFKIDSSGVESTLYTFTGTPDGSTPLGGLVRDTAGNLYGLTFTGGTTGNGTVFKLDTTGKETVLYSFAGVPDGAGPNAGDLILDASGNLFGTTGGGGTTGNGAVFELDPTGKETVLYSFTGLADGAWPLGGLVMDGKGNLYGTTVNGGVSGCNFGYGSTQCGVVFKLTYVP